MHDTAKVQKDTFTEEDLLRTYTDLLICEQTLKADSVEIACLNQIIQAQEVRIKNKDDLNRMYMAEIENYINVDLVLKTELLEANLDAEKSKSKLYRLQRNIAGTVSGILLTLYIKELVK